MRELKDVKNYCGSCKQKTWHRVEGMHSYSNNPEDYHCIIEHAVVKCKGCETVSFRRAFHDIEAAYPNGNDDWEVPVDVQNYPKPSKMNVSTYHLPKVVEKIYEQSCAAYRDGASTLAGIGFRATIEAICNDQGILGKELSTRINNLASKGLISKRDSKRLHSIRFLGNDAAHDIIIPSEESLEAALVIVEHLLNTVYILDGESKGKLQELIDEYENFQRLLENKIEHLQNGEELPLQGILGKEMRLLGGSIKELEKQLHENIGKGVFKLLAFGKNEKYLRSKEPMQHYKVMKS